VVLKVDISESEQSRHAAVPGAQDRALLVAQLLGTLAIIAFLPGNAAKAGALLVLWAATFRRIEFKEVVLVIGVCCFFTVMNAMSLAQGIFSFTEPDVLGMPVYELFMWGFYILHTKRMLGDAPPAPSRVAWGLALAYSAAFAAIKDAQVLLMVTGTLLAIAVFLFHTRRDLAFLGYMVLLGALIEYTGVGSGQWTYPGAPLGGVPPWFVTLWGGVGLFFHRLILPIMAPRPSPVLA
jgi:hypothetical protein